MADLETFVRVAFAALVFQVVWLPTKYGKADWPRFRGPNGSGVATNSGGTTPSEWSESKNLLWKVALPGPGASSPIIVGDKVLVTSYSGYGIDRGEPGELSQLLRHLTCYELGSGRRLWSSSVAAALPEDPYDQSGVSSHGYASHTPVSDGTLVYCFFGKGGVHAFNLNGKLKWSAFVGIESDPPRWGSSASPILVDDLLIVTAAAESQSIVAFEKQSGDMRWRQFATGLNGVWGTPIVKASEPGAEDMLLLVPNELWAIDSITGRLKWFSKATDSAQAYTSTVVEGQRIFASSGEGGGTVCIDTARKNGSVPSVVWRSSVSATYGSPVLYQSRLYVVSRDVLKVLDASSGTRIQQLRLRDARRVGNDRFGSLDYASPVIAGNRLFYQKASGQVYVFNITSEGAVPIAVNELGGDGEVFWGTPAISQGKLILRSSQHLYCIGSSENALSEVSHGNITLKESQQTNSYNPKRAFKQSAVISREKRPRRPESVKQ